MPAESAATLPQTPATEHVAFGPFTYDRANRLLWRDRTQVPLPPRAVGVLGLLLERPGQLLSKQDLISSVWPDAFVTETSLAEAISFLRQALADDSQNPTYIQTLHRRGYRFIADVQSVTPAGPRGPALRVEEGPGLRADVPAGPKGPALHDTDPAPRLGLLAPWITTMFAVMVATVAVWKFTHATSPAPRLPARFEIALPTGLAISSTGVPVAVSRDGMAIAFAVCRGPEGNCAIYLRPLSQPEATEIAGTGGGSSPFFSPDGRWLGYFADGRLQKIALAGGSPIALAEAHQPLGATWTADDRIVFAASTGGLSMVSANGGPVTELTHAAAGTEHRWPDALPDGTAVVFSVSGGAHQARAYAGVTSRRAGAWSRLLDGVSAVRAPVDGYLLAARGDDVIGVRFDERSLSVAGTPVSVLPGGGNDGFAPRFAMSAGGTLVIAPPGSSVLQIVLDWDNELRRIVPAPQPPLPR